MEETQSSPALPRSPLSTKAQPRPRKRMVHYCDRDRQFPHERSMKLFTPPRLTCVDSQTGTPSIKRLCTDCCLVLNELPQGVNTCNTFSAERVLIIRCRSPHLCRCTRVGWPYYRLRTHKHQKHVSEKGFTVVQYSRVQQVTQSQLIE